MQETWVWSLGQEDSLEKEMATHSSILAWDIPWREESGGLWSMGSQKVRHNFATEHTRAVLIFNFSVVSQVMFPFSFLLTALSNKSAKGLSWGEKGAWRARRNRVLEYSESLMHFRLKHSTSVMFSFPCSKIALLIFSFGEFSHKC